MSGLTKQWHQKTAAAKKNYKQLPIPTMNLPFLNSLKFASLEAFIITHMINSLLDYIYIIFFVCLFERCFIYSVYFLMPFSRCLNYVVSLISFAQWIFIFLLVRKLFIIIHVIYLLYYIYYYLVLFLLFFFVSFLSTKTYVKNVLTLWDVHISKLWMKFWIAIKK